MVEALRFTAQVLAEIAEEGLGATLPAEEIALAIRCQTWAGEVAAVVLGIEGAISPEPEPEAAIKSQPE